MGPIQERSREPSVGRSAEHPGIGPVLQIDGKELFENSHRLVQVGGAGLESMRLAGRMPAHAHRRPGQPGDLPSPRDAEPEIPVEHVSIGRVESAEVVERGAAERHRRATERIPGGHLRGQLVGRQDAIDGSETASSDDGFGDGFAAIVDYLRCAGDQPDALVGLECQAHGQRGGRAP